MGCASSNQQPQSELTKVMGENLLDSYLQVEKDIWNEEQDAPAPRLGHAMARLDRLNTEIETTLASLTEDREYNVLASNVLTDHVAMIETSDESIRRCLVELEINRNMQQALEHEEFIANLTRKALKTHQLYLLNRKKMDTEDEITKLSEKVQRLQRLYEHQELILVEGLGASGSRSEVELDRIRSYRDTLYSGELTWMEAIKLVQASSVLTSAGVDSWLALQSAVSADSRFTLATETRNTIQEAALNVQTAQSLLPAVSFPYCTSREILAILQILEYIYTDLQIWERYSHATEVYKSFHKRVSALAKWINQMMEDTIVKDVYEVDQKIEVLSGELRSERVEKIKQKV
ncbi:unnamed protein product [Bemisia tabaci]|uniref:Uncharacterized protein n=1 Tax=Bemisia tabaci TaxID=7038 RepID=A0A9P0CC90_BEMTA|nr:PREDICTED: uncharacterized protein LOC109040961 [Bemisia tabaci]CAH0771549.1 unnamed protein product [Bemisia tabaci]